MRRLLVLMAAFLGLASAYLKSYEVTPTLATWSGWASGDPQYAVGEQFTANFDSITEVSLFTGSPGAGQNYNMEVRDAQTNDLVAYQNNVAPAGDHTWLRFTSIVNDGKFVRGREYVVRFTRPGDSINWYKSANNEYHYGHMVGGTGLQPPGSWDDLCLRIYGKARVGGEFAVHSNMVLDRGLSDSANWQTCIEREKEVGVKYDKIGYGYWGYVQPDSANQWNWEWMDYLMTRFARESVGTIMSIRGLPGWASCSEYYYGGWHKDGGSLPVNIFEPVIDTTLENRDSINPVNYLAKYAYELARRYGPRGYAFNGSRCGTFWDSDANLRYQPILMYESYPELPLCAMRQDSGYENRGFWRLDTASTRLIDPVYRDLIHDNSLPERKNSFLQVAARVLIVVDSAVKMACTNPDAGSTRPSTVGYVWGDGHVGVYSMPEWLDGLKSYHADEFFDLASYFGYIGGVFQPEAHANTLIALRDTMIGAGYAPRGFVLTEFGTPPPAPQTQTDRAYHLLKAYAVVQAASAIPGCPVDVAAWFVFTAQYMGHAPDQHVSPDRDSSWAIVDSAESDWESWAPARAYQQWGELCQGASFEGRIPPYNNPADTIWNVYVLQFRDSLDKRFWIAWQPMAAGWWQWGPSTLRVPARADTAHTCGVDTGQSPQPSIEMSEPTGWFAREFDTFPVIIREGENFSRPDLIVDSVKLVPPQLAIGRPATAHVHFRNAGNAATPIGPGIPVTWVVLRHNGDSVAQAAYEPELYPSDTGSVSICLDSVPAGWRGSALFDATANYNQQYVELGGMDDNDGYSRNQVVRGPGGIVDVIVSPLCKAGAPILPLRLESHSWESDSTGETPADSARVLFAWYGQGDSVVQATDTTAWFPFCTDTVLEYPRGCGVYRVYAQFRDSGANDSPFYGDSTDSIVVFDSVPPAGSIIIEDGGEFASSSTRALRLAASDSAAGVAMMRFMNRPRVNLVENGGFDPAGGSWSFTGTGSGYDTSLQMARLAVAPSWESKATQFVPAESISAYSGDSCVLEASILAHVHDGEATGEVSFWFWSTPEDTSQHDTIWTLVDSACYTGDLLSLTGLYDLSTRFLLETPAPESGWVWRGGMVRVRAQAVDDGVGTVWCDDVFMNAYEPQASGYTWWGQYDSVAQWDIGSTAGQHIVRAIYLDSAGTENVLPFADTVILDPTPPVVDINLPDLGQLIGGLVQVTGWAYDPVEVAGDTFFESRRLFFKNVDSTNWLPVSPDSVSYEPAYPDSMASQGPAVHLGYWNTLEFEDGVYYLLLTASDSAGNTSSCTTWVVVANVGGGGGFCGGPEGGGSGMGEGSVFVGSATGTVLHLSDDLDSLDAFSVSDSGSQANITAILEVGEDSLLILDAANRRVHKLHRNGQNRRRLVSNLSQPSGLTRDENGNFWLVDKGIHRIGKFRSNGTLVFVRGGLGADSLHFHSPEGIALKGNLVYVADTKNDRIAVWDTSGNFKATITGDFENPTAVYVADSGTIYLTDGSDGKLKGITPLGGNIVAIGTTDSSKLKGLVPSENRHSLFSLAGDPNRVYKLRIRSDDSLPEGVQSGGKVNLPKTLSLAQPFPNPARTRLNIAYALPRQTRVALKLYDVAGKLVKTLANGEQKPGYYNLVWNRQDAKGRSCACGVYFCTLAAENQRFSRKVVLTE